MNAPFGGALDSSPSHPPEVYADRKKIIKDGRHVGLDFYDLLIEALMECSPPKAPCSSFRGLAMVGLQGRGCRSPRLCRTLMRLSESLRRCGGHPCFFLSSSPTRWIL